MTHTYAIVQISKHAVDEIRAKLESVGYSHTFHEDGVIDMHGLAVQALPENLRSTPLTDAVVRPYIGQDGVSIQECDDLLNHGRKMEEWVNDLQSGMFINCVYCGHRYGPKETTPPTMADLLKAHIEQCPTHPLSAARARLDWLLNELRDEQDINGTGGPNMAMSLLQDFNERFK